MNIKNRRGKYDCLGKLVSDFDFPDGFLRSEAVFNEPQVGKNFCRDKGRRTQSL